MSGHKIVGRFSRSKGNREERFLVAHLKALGYEAKRVPGSGASMGFKHDVIATRDGVETSYELKSRHDLFRWVYNYLAGKGPKKVSYQGKMLGIGDTPDEAAAVGYEHAFVIPEPGTAWEKTVKRLFNLEKYLAESATKFKEKDFKKADFLVLKCNHGRRLFLKFWG